MSVDRTARATSDLSRLIAESKNCHKIAWSYHIYVSQCEIKVEKHIAVWVGRPNKGSVDEDSRIWKRYCNLCIPLDWYNCFREFDEPRKLLKTTNKYLTVVGDSIEFNGGYLMIMDPGLELPLRQIGLVFDAPVSESLHKIECEPFTKEPNTLHNCLAGTINSQPNERKSVTPVGRNIHVEADIEMRSTEGFQPILFFSQNDDNQNSDISLGNAYLAITTKSSENGKGSKVSHNIYWEISRQMFYLSGPFAFDHSDSHLAETHAAWQESNDRHTIIVSQDSNWFPEREGASDDNCNYQKKEERVYFEFLVDSIGLSSGIMYIDKGDADNFRALNSYLLETCIAGNAEGLELLFSGQEEESLSYERKLATNSRIDHPIGSGTRGFYVGYAPDPPECGIEEALSGHEYEDKDRIFRGKLRRLFFDPNSSCAACT